MSKIQTSARLTTTALLGLALVRSTRASAAHPPGDISACKPDDLGSANAKVTTVMDYACPLHGCGREGAACGEQNERPKQGALSASS
jgi:hypothetical protein